MSEPRAPPRLVVRVSNGIPEGSGFRVFWELHDGSFYPALEYMFPPFKTIEAAIAFGEEEYGRTAVFLPS